MALTVVMYSNFLSPLLLLNPTTIDTPLRGQPQPWLAQYTKERDQNWPSLQKADTKE